MKFASRVWPVLLLAQVVAVAVPLGTLVALHLAGLDATGIAATVLTVTLTLSALGALVEALCAWPRTQVPVPRMPPPPATAIVAAYLPNEAGVLDGTIDALLRMWHPGRVQIIVAYNTPVPHPYERHLHARAAGIPGMVVLPVVGSRSKAENVMAALPLARGGIIGIFDADHHPTPDAFGRAWPLLAAGADVVQGHCVVRNDGASRMAAVVAPEFAAMYGVAHPGRARLHGFGLFGGSNGYWRADVLRRIGMRADMLTEDIDASVRVVLAGGRIACHPTLYSSELAPLTLAQFTHQRLRWAQGWFQVAGRHLPAILTTPRLGLRRRLGLLWLFAWCSVTPWLAAAGPVVLAAQVTRGEVLLATPVGLALLALSMATGPVQLVVARRHAPASLGSRPVTWWLWHALVALVVLGPLRDALARTAHVRHLLGNREWRVTPRATATPRHRRDVPPARHLARLR